MLAWHTAGHCVTVSRRLSSTCGSRMRLIIWVFCRRGSLCAVWLPGTCRLRWVSVWLRWAYRGWMRSVSESQCDRGLALIAVLFCFSFSSLWSTPLLRASVMCAYSVIRFQQRFYLTGCSKPHCRKVCGFFCFTRKNRPRELRSFV